jgi:hypothetical protein
MPGIVAITKAFATAKRLECGGFSTAFGRGVLGGRLEDAPGNAAQKRR